MAPSYKVAQLYPRHISFTQNLSERPVTCRCCLSVYWPVNNPATSLHFSLSEASKSLDSCSEWPSMKSFDSHTWCASSVFRVLLSQPLLNLRSANIWWNWNSRFRTKQQIARSLHSEPLCIFTALNPSVTTDPKGFYTVPIRQDTNFLSTFPDQLNIILDASRAWKTTWLSK
jgi:hypothetical protein